MSWLDERYAEERLADLRREAQHEAVVRQLHTDQHKQSWSVRTRAWFGAAWHRSPIDVPPPNNS